VFGTSQDIIIDTSEAPDFPLDPQKQHRSHRQNALTLPPHTRPLHPRLGHPSHIIPTPLHLSPRDSRSLGLLQRLLLHLLDRQPQRRHHLPQRRRRLLHPLMEQRLRKLLRWQGVEPRDCRPKDLLLRLLQPEWQ